MKGRPLGRPLIRKLGTLDCDMVETTPVVFKGRLYRFENVRDSYWTNSYWANKAGTSYFRLIDVESGEPTPAFGAGHHLASAHVQDDVVYVYGVSSRERSKMTVFRSEDMENWSSQVALRVPGWKMWNNSVCKADGRYVMAVEISEPPEETGVSFTIRFAESDDLLAWRATPPECVYSKERYTACPAIRFVDGAYYMIYLEARYEPVNEYESHIVRSRDLIHWQSSPLNPVTKSSGEDKVIANPRLTASQRECIANAVNINNSDVDLCEFNGKTIIYYSWGNQNGIEFLAHAVYDGTLRNFLCGFFEEFQEGTDSHAQEGN